VEGGQPVSGNTGATPAGVAEGNPSGGSPKEETGPYGQKWLSPLHQEKPSSENRGCPYPKPTQVEAEELRRRVSEPSLRNSAS
jgi:hypothetical protein